jgi:hypothetical protein
MKLEALLNEWKADSVIDRTELGDSAAEISKLHAKYLRYFTDEKLRHILLMSKMKQLRLAKHEHYTQGASKETLAKGWTMPPRGAVLKTDAPMYLEADKEIGDLQVQIDVSQVKLDAMESIIKAINNRGYIIRDMIDWARWTGGA